MGETLLKGGTIIDGTGAPRRDADLLISGDRIKAVGKGLGTTGRVIDVTGLTVTPGIIDPHTHLDGQFFFDPAGSSTSWHGVTTVLMGHCGYSLAPVKPEHRDYIIHMFARVEEIPLDIFYNHIPWDWVSFGQYMDSLDRRGLGINTIPQVGHSTLRYHVMGPAAVQRASTEAELVEMRGVLREALDAGAFGFSTSRAPTQISWNGEPVPSRWAAPGEVIGLAQELSNTKVGTLGLIPTGVFAGFTQEDKEVIFQMALRSKKAIQLNGAGRLAARDYMVDAARQGVRVYAVVGAQTRSPGFLFTFADGTSMLDSMATWSRLMNSPAQERLKGLADPALRPTLRAEVDSEPMIDLTKLYRPHLNWSLMVVSKAAKSGNRNLEGTSIKELAERQGKHLADTMLDLAQSEDWETQFQIRSPGANIDHAELLRHPHFLPMNTDSGAHLGNICKQGESTAFLRQWVLEKGIMSLEDGIRRLTSDTAKWIGIPDRGVLSEGMAADVAAFDMARLECKAMEQVWDLPGGAGRWVQRAVGVEHVFVNGEQTIQHGKPLGALPGKVIRNTHYR